MKDFHEGLPVPSNVDIFGCCGLLERLLDESEDEIPDCCPSLESVEDDEYPDRCNISLNPIFAIPVGPSVFLPQMFFFDYLAFDLFGFERT
jgi:hypothetical protein